MTLTLKEQGRFITNSFNAMAQIIAQYNGKILKNIGDGLASYFPKTSDDTDDNAIKDVLECCLKQIERRQSLSIEMAREKLPEISYKICADYGVLNYEINLNDAFDKPPWLPPVYKICSNMSPNTAVLGYDLYKIITTLPRIQEKYLIEGIGEYTGDSRKDVPYSVYSLARRT